jgi:hypothetical protein
LVPRIYSELYQNIQSGFHAAGLDMTAAHFRINMPFQDPALLFPPPGDEDADADAKADGEPKAGRKAGRKASTSKKR